MNTAGFNWKAAKTEFQKRMILAGVQRNYWDCSIDNLEPSTVIAEIPHFNETKKITITAQEQQIWLNHINKNTPESLQLPYLLVVGSSPTDEAGLTLAYHFMAKAQNNLMSPVSIDIMCPEITLKEVNDPQFFVIKNITQEASWDRIFKARDYIERYDNFFRIVVVAGEPLNFCLTKIRKEPDAVLYFTKRVARKKIIY